MAGQKTSTQVLDKAAPSAGSIEPVSDPQLQTALYLESMAADLGALAQRAHLDSLAYFFEMARVEASIQIAARADQPSRKHR